MKPEEARQYADRLLDAVRTGVPIAPLTSERPDLSVADAYAIQTEMVASMLARGDHVVGYKLGVTSRPMQELFGVDQPDFAPVLASGVVEDGAAVEMARLI